MKFVLLRGGTHDGETRGGGNGLTEITFGTHEGYSHKFETYRAAADPDFWWRTVFNAAPIRYWSSAVWGGWRGRRNLDVIEI